MSKLSHLKPVICLFPILFLAGCATQKQMQHAMDELMFIRSQIQILNRQLEDQQATLKQFQLVLQSIGQVQKELWSLEDSLKALQISLDRLRADISSELYSIKEYTNYLNTKFEDINNRSNRLIGRVEALTDKITAQLGGGSGKANPLELFQNAYLDFSRGNLKLAQEGFLAYLELYPNSELADHCHYYLGEIHYQSKEWAQAINRYEIVVNNFPKSSRVPNALLKMGICYKNLNEPAKAQQYFNEVIQKFPNTEEAAQARARL